MDENYHLLNVGAWSPSQRALCCLKRACEGSASFPHPRIPLYIEDSIALSEYNLSGSLAQVILFFSCSHKFLRFAAFYLGFAIFEFFERTSTPCISYTGSNVSMDSSTDSWDPSGALSDAPYDDVSCFLLVIGLFLRTV